MGDVPVTLEVEQFDRMLRVAKFGRVLAGAVDSNAEVPNARLA
jgi:hypothetical protein